MKLSDIPALRSLNQQILHSKFKKPEEIVSYLGAVQSQDFYGAKWALGLRLPGSTDTEIETGFNAGKILRTHALRPTWHFVVPGDIKWIMDLNAPQVKKVLGYYNTKLNLNNKLFEKTNNIIRSALKGKNLTRPQLQAILKEEGFEGTGQRIGHIIGWAELDNIICSGPRIGKQFTYALIDEVAPNAKTFSRDKSLAKLAEIFFKTRGPATIKDFSKWSYLSQSDCKKGLDFVKSKFKSEIIEGREYWFSSNLKSMDLNQTTVHILPNYDEYISSYSDYDIFNDPKYRKNLTHIGNAVFLNHLLVNGKIVGSWKRIIKPKLIEVKIYKYRELDKKEAFALEKAIEGYKLFNQLPVSVEVITSPN